MGFVLDPIPKTKGNLAADVARKGRNNSIDVMLWVVVARSRGG